MRCQLQLSWEVWVKAKRQGYAFLIWVGEQLDLAIHHTGNGKQQPGAAEAH